MTPPTAEPDCTVFESRRSRRPGTTFLNASENANWSLALMLGIAATGGVAMAAVLSMVDVHDPAIAWIVCLG